MLAQLLAGGAGQPMASGMGGMGMGGYEQPDAESQQEDNGEQGEDWLTTAINAVHAGMVHEGDPKQVSLLGAILNQLTTFQANAANQAGAGGR